MALKVTFENTQEIILSDNYKGILSPCHGVYYLFKTGKLGEVTEGAGKTPQEAINDRYAGKLSANDKNIEIAAYFVFDKNPHKLRQYDNTLREYIDTQHKGGVIPFGACHLGNKIEGKNTEALIDFDATQHLPTLIECVKSHHGISQHFNTRKPFKPRFGQQKAIDEIVDRLLNKNKCLFSGYTSIGKTIISMVSVLKYFREWDKKGFPNWKRGGLVLVTTPISNTLNSFTDDLDFVDVGATRSQKYSYMTKKDWKNTSLENITKRTDDGEVIFLLLTAHDLFYPPKDGGDYSDKIRPEYNNLTGKIDLWVRDEGHKFYRGERTSTLLDCLKASAILDLSATPYNFLDTYSKDTIVNRDLLWGSKYREYTGLPEIAIESYETPFAGLSDKIKAVYDVEEGYDPRKWFVRDDNGAYVYVEDIVETYDCKYVSVFPKDKNHLNVNLADKRVSLDVLPSGEDGDGAADKYPDLAKVLNQRIKTRYFIDAWTLENISKSKNIKLEKCVDELLDKYQAVNILTCRKFTTGTNIPQISHINLFDKISSPAELIQLIGRACRKVESKYRKNRVMLYNHCPGNKIKLALGIASRKSADLSGESQAEYLDCIPFTEYAYNETNPIIVRPEEIISEVNEYYKNKSNPRPRKDTLTTSLLESIPDWDLIELCAKYKFSPNTMKGKNLNNKNDSKVKTTTNTGTTNPTVDKKVTQVVNLFTEIFIESTWVAFTNEHYDVMKVLKSKEMVEMFDNDDLSTVRDIVNPVQGKNSIYKFFDSFLKDKEEAYSSLSFEQVHDDIFINTARKRKIGLVYFPIDLARKLIIDNNLDKLYNEGKRNFIIINALSGSVPYLLRKKYPDLNIFCGEYYSYFKNHLKKLLPSSVVLDVEIKDNKLITKGNKMKFDVILTNSPYQNKKEGNRQGSSDNPLWMQITELGFKNLLKENGLYVGVTPTTIVTGSEKFTKLFLGKNAPYNLKSVDFSADEYFNVGIKICSWVASNVPSQGTAFTNDDRAIKTQRVNYISDNSMFDSILETLLNCNEDKLTFNQSKRYDYDRIEKELKKIGQPIEWAKDLVDNADEEHPYAVANNDKIKYSRIKCKDYGVWRVFIPQFIGTGAYDKVKFWIDDKMGATGSTWTHRCSSKEEAERVYSYINIPEYKWIINELKVNDRLTSKVRDLPIVSLSKILSEEQMSYIRSHIINEE